MNYRISISKILLCSSLIIIFSQLSTAQTSPRQQKLLNGLNVLIWNEPQAEKITVKLRIHSGAAFDPKDKMGVMALLADGFFPTEQAKSYFTEDLEGSLNVVSNYDFIQITATGKTDELVSMLETMATAMTNPQTLKENFKAVQEARLAKVKQLETQTAYAAESQTARQLFGDFPYGRSAEGTSESLAKIDVSDVLFARERFLTPDNATLAIIGNVKPETAYRAARQLFGAWSKADRKIPATFRLPEGVIEGRKFINSPESEKVTIYQAVRAPSRNSKDYFAAAILADSLSKRAKNIASQFGGEASVFYNPRLLFGSLIFAFTVAPEKTDALMQAFAKQKLGSEITDADFQISKNLLVNQHNQSLSDKNAVAEFWLDADTYKLAARTKQLEILQAVSLADVNRVLRESLKNNSFVEVMLGDAAKLGNSVLKK